jgi:RNA polymerase sigma-70 factor (ECF subfamily)
MSIEYFPNKLLNTKTVLIMASQDLQLELLFKRILEKSDSTSFEALFKSQYALMCSFAKRYLDSAEAAEEAVSEVFYKIWKNRAQINIKTSAKYYLYASVRNMAIDLRRQSKSQFHVSDECLSMQAYPGPTAAETLIGAETQQKIDSAILRLPTQCRKVFQLSRQDGLKYQEIANQLGISIKTVETQMTRALKQLRVEVLKP